MLSGLHNSTNDTPSVLIIDDDYDMRALLTRLLQASGFQTTTAEIGDTGIAIAEEFQPNLILLDVNMPGKDGFDVCRRLKSQLSTADIPVVFVTGADPTDDTVTVGFDAGADDFLAKPINRVHLMARVRVILRQQALREAYRRLANQDALTELMNRRQIFLNITEAVMSARRDSTECILILADLDHFKQVNDAGGHDFGDEVLVTFSRLLKRCTSSSCVAGRIGGEEFVLLLTDATPDHGLAVANRIRETFSAIAFDADTQPKHYTASFGVAAFDGTPEDFDADLFLKQADIALYAAKEAGRNRSVAFWSLDPNALPEIDPSKKHYRSKRRKRTERAYLRVEDSKATAAPAPAPAPAKAPQNKSR